MKKFCAIIAVISIPLCTFSQNTWDLERCVDYALQHNISVRQSDVQRRLSAIQLKSSKAQQIPTLSFSTQASYNFGRSIDPTTNQFTTNEVFSQNYGLQTGVTLFNFFRIKNTIKADKAQNTADANDVNRVKSDVALNVAAAYLQYLLSLEQVNIAKGQIGLSQQQLELIKKQVNVGSLPILNVAQLESQLATDSSTYITNVSTMNQNKLKLMALLNLSAEMPFEVSLPDVDNIPLENIAEINPKGLYEIALHNQYQQKVDSFKILSAEYAAKSAKAALYPTLSAFGSIGSNYGSYYTHQVGSIPYPDTVSSIIVGGKNYYSIVQRNLPIYDKVSYWDQIFNSNLSQNIGISLNIPIFNNRQARSGYERAKENVISLHLQQEQNNQTLQQNVYTAYNNAQAGLQSYNSNTKGENYAAYAFELAEKRYNIGKLSTSDYIIAQNKLYTAKMNKAAAHYEYIFRLKVLEFYKYNHIRLKN